MRHALLLLLALAALACGPARKPDGSGGSGGVAGSSSGTLNLEALNVLGGTTPVPLVSGGTLELFAPPQGGFVVLIGARVAGLDSKTIELSATLSTPEGQLLAESTRTTELVASSTPDWLETDAGNLYSTVHLTLCPAEPSVVIEGAPTRLKVDVTELYADFSTASVELDLVPTCPSGGASPVEFCRCQCGVASACGAPGP